MMAFDIYSFSFRVVFYNQHPSEKASDLENFHDIKSILRSKLKDNPGIKSNQILETQFSAFGNKW